MERRLGGKKGLGLATRGRRDQERGPGRTTIGRLRSGDKGHLYAYKATSWSGV